MNTKKNTIKNLICSITAVLLFILANIGVLSFTKKEVKVFAASESSEITINNSNFKNDTTSSYPIKNPSDFKATVSTNNSGVINLSHDDYSTRFAKAKSSKLSTDDYVLMLTSNSINSNHGYTTQNEIKMEANSNYMVTVAAFTENDAPIGNICLYDENNKIFSSVDNINSYNTWTVYHMFVSTNQVAQNVKLGMNITDKGTILFDSISCHKISDNLLESRKAMQEDLDIDYSYVNKVDNIIKEYHIEGNKFVSDSEQVNILNTKFANGKNDTSYTEAKTVLDTNGKSSSAFKINNLQKTYVEYSTEDLITVDQNRLYSVSIDVKTRNLSGSATLKLVQTNLESGEKGTDSEVISITSNTSDAARNNYKRYSFYIKGSPIKTTTFKLVFALGDSSSETSGEMYVSNVTVSKINKDIYSNTDSSIKKIELTKSNNVDITYPSSSIYLNNGEFNGFEIEDYNAPIPAVATGWTVTKGKGEQVYGIVNTKDSEFNQLSSLNLNSLINPYSNNTNENVLMMYNNGKDTLSYTSSSKTLSANTYHKFTVDVLTQNAPVKLALVATNNDIETELCSLTIDTNYQWKKDANAVTFLIKTGYQSLNVSLKATLDSANYAYAYLDSATFDYYAPTETEFNNASNSTLVKKVDLSDMFSTDEDTQFASSLLYSADKNDDAIYGILNLERSDISEQINADYLTDFLSLEGENRKVLGIRTADDLYYKVTSNLGFKLDSGKKYKISVSVYTQNLRTNVKDVKDEELGVSLRLTGFDEEFSAISSNNKWTTYTFYIDSSSTLDSACLEFYMGSKDHTTIGDVFFGNIQFESEIDDTEFNAATANKTTLILKNAEEDKEEDKEESENSKNSNGLDKQTLLYLIPSLIFGVTIVIAIVGVLSRKIKWKKPTKKAKTEYDRTRTVNKQVYTRRASIMRETKLRELNKALEDLVASRTEAEEEYKANLSKLREMKIKRANPVEIAKLEKEMKKHQKTSSQVGMSVSRLQSEIEYVKTEHYFKAILKKLSQERDEKDQSNQDQNNNK